MSLMTRWPGKLALIGAAISSTGMFLAETAFAGLAQSADSVASDHDALHGTSLTTTSTRAMDIHEIALPENGRVREYSTPGGQVFATTWSTRAPPDLRVLLAQRYGAYAAAATARHAGHHILQVTTPDLTIRLVTLPRRSTGTAIVPALVPAGVSAQDIQ
jgi:hypothetical protein